MKPLKNRIDTVFADLKKKKEKALIIYFTAGDPDIKETLKILHTLVDAGADLIEIGVPFSDPMGDGVSNQKAAERALKKKTNLKMIFSTVKEFRKTNTHTPLILFSYLNPVYNFGYGKFAEACRSTGVDGGLFVDMPYDEEMPLQKSLSKENIHTIFLAAPTTEDKRLKDIARKTRGFLYAVSSMGVTGVRKDFEKGFSAYINKAKKYSSQPVCVGFGISTPEMAKKASSVSDGVIVGSAVVNIIEKLGASKKKMHLKLKSFVSSIKKSM